MLPAYNTEEGETADWRQTAEKCENERQRDAKKNWNSWQLRNRRQKNLSNFRKKHLFKYINIYNSVYQRYTGPEKERKQRETKMKYGWGELKKRNAGTEDYWSWRELQKLNAKEKNRSGNAKNGKCRNDIRTPRKNEEKYAEYRYKRKKFLYTAESMKISWKLWRIKINANISSTIFYIFILLRIKTFISTNNQAETAFYAKEEGLRKVKEEQSK